jgi:hypothetical protein
VQQRQVLRRRLVDVQLRRAVAQQDAKVEEAEDTGAAHHAAATTTTTHTRRQVNTW